MTVLISFVSYNDLVSVITDLVSVITDLVSVIIVQ